MPHPTKIATCCYCSARTLLKPTARKGHELACGSCGAPLHEMKWLKSPEPARPAREKPAPKTKVPKTKAPHFRTSLLSALTAPAPKGKPYKKDKKRRKPRKSSFRKLMEEAWDIAEDIFD